MATTASYHEFDKDLDELERFESRKGSLTWEMAQFYPRQGEWTEEEYLRLDTNRMIELSDGCLEFLPMPTVLHQLIVRFLLEELERYLKRTRTVGVALFAPCPIRLWQGEYREPDLFYLRPERMKNLRGQPDGMDLAFEVVSPGDRNKKRDHESKREIYAEAGVAEYWIVDPQQKSITVLVLDGTAYRVHGVFEAGATATSVLLPGFEVSVDATFSIGEAIEQQRSPNGS